MCNVNIRNAELSDAAALAEIYRPYVENTAVSFEYTAPTAEEFAKRIENTVKNYPYLILIVNDETVGYCYAGPLKTRQAYSKSVEISVYIKKEFQGNGYGKRLYSAMEYELKNRGILNIYACITYSDKEDEFHNNNSMRFHEHMGYSLCGKFNNCGNKFGRWYSVVWMEKMIGEHT